MSFSRDVHRAPDEALCDEAVVDRDDEEWDNVEDKEGSGGVDLGVQLLNVWVGGAGHKRLIGVAGGEGVQVREDGFWDGQSHGEQPDGPHPYTHAESSSGRMAVQRPDYGFVPGQRHTGTIPQP